MTEPLRGLPAVLDERDYELGATIETLKEARAKHDEAGAKIAERSASMVGCFGLAEQGLKQKTSYRDSLSPRIMQSIAALEADTVGNVEAESMGMDPAAAGA